MDYRARPSAVSDVDRAFLAGAAGRVSKADSAAAELFGTGTAARKGSVAFDFGRSRAPVSRGGVDGEPGDRAVQDRAALARTRSARTGKTRACKTSGLCFSGAAVEFVGLSHRGMGKTKFGEEGSLMEQRRKLRMGWAMAVGMTVTFVCAGLCGHPAFAENKKPT